MRALPVLANCHPYPPYLLLPSLINTNLPFGFSKSVNLSSNICLLSRRHISACSRCFDAPTADPTPSDDTDGGDFDSEDDNDNDCATFTREESTRVAEEGVVIAMRKMGRNWRRIRSKIGIEASLETVWSILTDYERLVDFIPGLSVCKLIEKKGNFARLYQIGQQNLPFGLKFNAKATLDCYEKDLEILTFGKRRDIEFKMTEGDFQVFEGKWSIEQFNKPTSGDGDLVLDQEFETTLSYIVDVKPKLWLPVHLVEDRIYKEIKTNLSCIREEAQKMIQNTLQAQ